jgi:hypothetical protein
MRCAGSLPFLPNYSARHTIASIFPCFSAEHEAMGLVDLRDRFGYVRDNEQASLDRIAIADVKGVYA